MYPNKLNICTLINLIIYNLLIAIQLNINNINEKII